LRAGPPAGEGGGRGHGRAPLRDLPGSWPAAAALFVYAIAFSFAYLRLGAATGALILFVSVQGTMVGAGLVRGDRPTASEAAGLAIALAGFVALMLPGLGAPDLLGTASMVAAGAAWGVYTLRGRGGGAPLAATAGNFLRSIPLCLPLLAVALFTGSWTSAGVGYALASGILASGLGYAVWYRALPGLSTTQAAVVQLTVPVIAALGAVVLLGEPQTLRFAILSTIILGGVALAILGKGRRARG